MEDKELKALINLLDDTDNEVFNHVESTLVSLGKEVIPFLEDAWSGSLNALLQERIENIIHKIQLDTLLIELQLWSKYNSGDLLSGCLIIARYQYPDLEEEKVRIRIEELRREAWLEMNDQLTAYEKVRVLNRVLFDHNGFSGNTTNYHAPQNSFINIVLESKKGNPLLLCIVYSLIAQKLDMPVYGVNLPEHFVLAYLDHPGTDEIKQKDESEPTVLFYINAFSRGMPFGKNEIDVFLKKISLNKQLSFYYPCSNIEIMKRMIRNLVVSYEKLGHVDKVEELNRMLSSFEEKP